MQLDIPFFQSKKNQCMQAAMRSIINYFHKKEVSLEELDKLTKRKEWTWPTQAIPVFDELGLNVKLYTKADYNEFMDDKKILKKYGSDGEKILRLSDMESVRESIEKSRRFTQKIKLRIKELEDFINKGYGVITLLNNNIIYSKGKSYAGHFVVLTGFDKEYFYYHESMAESPEKNKKIDKKMFSKAWDSPGAERSTIVISGKK